jgi:hypothetical protein
MLSLTALVQPYSRVRDMERRAANRQRSGQEAIARPQGADRTLSWGASVSDISDTGIGLSVCYPFRPGTYLIIKLVSADGAARTCLARVVHVLDQKDGTWHVGCEFAGANDDNGQ